ncbi:MAG: hypothetical protein ABW069_05600 [Duganella sp.]
MTPAQQAEADRNRILSQLEAGKVGKSGKPAVRRARSRRAMIAAGVAGLALAAGIGWMVQGRDADRQLAAVAAAGKDDVARADNDHMAPAAATASGADGASGPVGGAAPADVPPPAAVIQEDRVAQAQDKEQSLSDMLDEGGTPIKADHAALAKTLEATPAAAKSAPRAHQKVVAKEKAKPKSTNVAKAETDAETTPEQENDIALLSALITHAQAEERAAAHKKPRVPLKEQLAQCKKLAPAKAAQCHARVCDGRSKTGECKVRG